FSAYLRGLLPRLEINKASPPPQLASPATPGARSATTSLLTPNRGRNLPNSVATSGRNVGQGSIVANNNRIARARGFKGSVAGPETPAYAQPGIDAARSAGRAGTTDRRAA